MCDCILGTDAQTEFRVAYSPQEVCGLRGSWVLMQCSYSLPEGPRFAAGHWYKTNLKTPRDTMFVPPSKGSVEYIITSRICRLRINSLKESDAGIYDFRVTPLTFAQMKDSHGVTLAVSGKCAHGCGMNLHIYCLTDKNKKSTPDHRYSQQSKSHQSAEHK